MSLDEPEFAAKMPTDETTTNTEREAEARRKIKGRNVMRRCLKKIVTETGELMRDNETSQVFETLLTNKELIRAELEGLKRADNEIIDLLMVFDEKGMETEIMSTRPAYAEAQHCMTKIETTLKSLAEETAATRRHSTSSSAQKPKVTKLPHLKLNSFSGNTTEWISFWETFAAAIDSDDTIEDVMKFSYLKSYLEGAAADAIAGLQVTNSAYKEAVETLKNRFGDRQAIVSSHIDKLIDLEPIATMQDTRKLRVMYDTVEANVRSLKTMGVSADCYEQVLTPMILKKVPNELRLTITRKLKDTWSFESLLEVFHEELQIREKCSLNVVGSGRINPPSYSADSRPRERAYFRNSQASAAALFSESRTENIRDIKCVYCDGKHKSHQCKVVTNHVTRRKILMEKNCCFICLRANHLARNCRTNMRCLKCDRRHHSTICESYGNNEEKPETTSNKTQQTTPETKESQSTANMHVSNKNSVLLQTARAFVRVPGETTTEQNVRLIFDSGSQKSYVTEELKRALNLPVIAKEKLMIKAFGDSSPKVRECEIVQIGIKCVDGVEVIMTAYVVPVICTPISNQVISGALERHPYLRGLELADFSSEDELNADKSVQILIGADFYWRLVDGEIYREDSSPLVAMKTRLGWVLSGPTEMVSDDLSPNSHVLNIQVMSLGEHESISNELKKFWENESIGIKEQKIEQNTTERFEQEIKFVDGKYQVKLPLKESHPLLPDNYDLAKRRLLSQLSKLKQNDEVAKQYDNVIKEQLNLGIIERVGEEASTELGGVTYLPHREILKPDRETTKIRVVFDASAKSGGPSLNDCLDAGPSLLPLLYDILLRFRLNKIALTGDIEKAFLNIRVAPEHRDLLRFLWVEDIEADKPKIVVYRFASVLFGCISSPFLLNQTVKHHMATFSDDEEFVNSVSSSLYCDDFIGGCNSVEDVLTLYEKLKTRFQQGGFNMRKWMSNCEEVLDKIGENENSVKVDSEFAQNTESEPTLENVCESTKKVEETKVLGMLWKPKVDELIFDFNAMLGASAEKIVSKREVLATTAKLFDPVGLISPIIVPLKLVFQKLCKQNKDWDASID